MVRKVGVEFRFNEEDKPQIACCWELSDRPNERFIVCAAWEPFMALDLLRSMQNAVTSPEVIALMNKSEIRELQTIKHHNIEQMTEFVHVYPTMSQDYFKAYYIPLSLKQYNFFMKLSERFENNEKVKKSITPSERHRQLIINIGKLSKELSEGINGINQELNLLNIGIKNITTEIQFSNQNKQPHSITGVHYKKYFELVTKLKFLKEKQHTWETRHDELDQVNRSLTNFRNDVVALPSHLLSIFGSYFKSKVKSYERRFYSDLHDPGHRLLDTYTLLLSPPEPAVVAELKGERQEATLSQPSSAAKVFSQLGLTPDLTKTMRSPKKEELKSSTTDTLPVKNAKLAIEPPTVQSTSEPSLTLSHAR